MEGKEIQASNHLTRSAKVSNYIMVPFMLTRTAQPTQTLRVQFQPAVSCFSVKPESITCAVT